MPWKETCAVEQRLELIRDVLHGEATLKKFYREKNGVRLQPANPAYEPIYVPNCTIQGIVIGVIRKV